MMMSSSVQGSFRSVAQYPNNLLRIGDNSVQVPVTYKKVWDDGFGARGWKVNATIGDPEITVIPRKSANGRFMPKLVVQLMVVMVVTAPIYP